MRLAIVGASARAAAWSALVAGFEVVAADLFADSDLAERCPTTQIKDWPKGFLPWLQSQEVDAWCYTGGLENHPQLIERMASVRPLWGCGSASLAMCRSMSIVSTMLKEAQLATPAVSLIPPNETEGWLVKPVASAGGMGVKDWRGEAGNYSQAYWQRRITGLPVAAAFASNRHNAVLLGVTQQLLGCDWARSHGYRYTGSIGPLDLPASVVEQITQAGQAIARHCGLVGVFGIDLVVDTYGTVWTIEVNPRYTASMELIEQLTDLNIMATHVGACSAGTLPDPPDYPTQQFAGKAHLFAQENIMVHEIVGQQLADIPAPGTAVLKGDPLCTLFAEGISLESVEANLSKRASELETQLFQSPTSTAEPIH